MKSNQLSRPFVTDEEEFSFILTHRSLPSEQEQNQPTLFTPRGTHPGASQTFYMPSHPAWPLTTLRYPVSTTEKQQKPLAIADACEKCAKAVRL